VLVRETRIVDLEVGKKCFELELDEVGLMLHSTKSSKKEVVVERSAPSRSGSVAVLLLPKLDEPWTTKMSVGDSSKKKREQPCCLIDDDSSESEAIAQVIRLVRL